MKIKFYILILALIHNFISLGQTPDWVWAKSAGGSESDAAQSIASDAAGNLYVVGYFRSSEIKFDNITLTNAGTGYSDVFIAKFNSSGNVLWAKSAGDFSYDEATSVAIDKYGFIYVTGYFQSYTITFDTITLVKNGLGCSDIFIVKYDPTGHVVWAKRAGGTSLDDPYSIALDLYQNVFITGYFQSSTINFGSTTLTNHGGNDIFFAKYDSDGNVLWAVSAGGSGYEQANSVTVDLFGNSYITGFFGSPILYFETLDTLYNNLNKNQIFIAKYSPDGTLIWAKKVKGNNSDVGNTLITDNNCNLYVAGFFRSDTIIFATDTFINPSQNGNFFIVKYDLVGNEQWVKCSTGDNWCYINSIKTDISDNIYITGGFVNHNLSLDSIGLINAGVTDILVAKYDPDGNVIWAKSVGNSNNEEAYSICVDSLNNIFIAGYFFSSSLSFGTVTLDNYSSDGNSYDIFITKLSDTTGINEPNPNNENSILIFPIPATTNLTIEYNQPAMLTLYNLLGQQLMQREMKETKTELDISSLARGMYFVKIESDDGVGVKKFVKE